MADMTTGRLPSGAGRRGGQGAAWQRDPPEIEELALSGALDDGTLVGSVMLGAWGAFHFAMWISLNINLNIIAFRWLLGPGSDGMAAALAVMGSLFQIALTERVQMPRSLMLIGGALAIVDLIGPTWGAALRWSRPLWAWIANPDGTETLTFAYVNWLVCLGFAGVYGSWLSQHAWYTTLCQGLLYPFLAELRSYVRTRRAQATERTEV